MEYCAGVDLGGSSAKLGLVQADGVLPAKLEVPIDRTASFSAIMDPIVTALRRLVGETGGKLMAIGICCPGVIDKRTNVLLGAAANIPLLKGNDLSAPFAGFGVPLIGDNDATCAAAGEFKFGRGRSWRDFLLITLGTGVGGGLVLDGRVFRGNRGFAGEIGHLCLDPGGIWCNCGNRGCLEQYASGPAMHRLYEEKRKKRGLPLDPGLSVKEIFDRARGGEELAGEVVREAGAAIARVLGMALNLLNLEGCLLGGGLSRAGEILLNAVRSPLADFCWPLMLEGTEIALAQLGNDAGMLGAAASAWERLGL